jgi:hypothetical protein
VLDVLTRAQRAASELAEIAKRADVLPAHRLALAHLTSAAVSVASEPPDGSGPGTLPEVPDFTEAARMLDAMTRTALEHHSTEQRRGRSDPARAVAMLLDALREAKDEESRRLLARVRPVAQPSAKNPFGAIALIVFTAAVGAEFKDLRATVDAWHRHKAVRRRVPALSAGISTGMPTEPEASPRDDTVRLPVSRSP